MPRPLLREARSPEERLVLAATRPASVYLEPGAAIFDADAAESMRVARRNKVVPHLARFVDQHLTETARDRWTDLFDLAGRYARHARSQHQETIAILKELLAQGVEACPMKGTFLSLDLYADPTRRQSSDLDILVRPEHFPSAIRVLRQRGYQMMRPRALPDESRMRLLLDASRQYNVALIDDQRRFCVELHWRLTNFRVFPGEQTHQLWERLGTRNVEGIQAARLTDPDLMLYMAVHGTKDYWRRLSWLTDFAQFAARNPDAVVEARANATRWQLRVTWEASCALADTYYGTHLYEPPPSHWQRERVRFVVDHVRLLWPDFAAPSYETFAYEWNSRDNWRASIQRTFAELMTPNYSGAVSEDDYDPAMQRRRRVVNRLRRLLSA